MSYRYPAPGEPHALNDMLQVTEDPHEALMLAVLERALTDATWIDKRETEPVPYGYTGKDRREQRLARCEAIAFWLSVRVWGRIRSPVDSHDLRRLCGLVGVTDIESYRCMALTRIAATGEPHINLLRKLAEAYCKQHYLAAAGIAP